MLELFVPDLDLRLSSITPSLTPTSIQQYQLQEGNSTKEQNSKGFYFMIAYILVE